MERIRLQDMPPLPTRVASPSATTSDACPGCGGSGWYLLKVPHEHPRWGELQRCECQSDKPLPSHVAMLSRLRGDLGHLAECSFNSFNTDRRLEPCEWNGDTYSVEAQREDLTKAYMKSLEYSGTLSGWLYLFGNYGAGKSHLAAAIANAAAARNVQTTYASVPKLLDFIRAGYKDGTATERIDALSAVELLVLDDLGAEAGKRDTDELLFSLFNHRSRERANLPTVVTSNVHPDHLEPRIADRVYGQTDGGARIVWLPIYSYRRLR